MQVYGHVALAVLAVVAVVVIVLALVPMCYTTRMYRLVGDTIKPVDGEMYLSQMLEAINNQGWEPVENPVEVKGLVVLRHSRSCLR